MSKTSKSFGVKATESDIKSNKKSPISKGGGKVASIANDIEVEDILGNTQNTFKHSDKKSKSNKNEDLGSQSNKSPRNDKAFSNKSKVMQSPRVGADEKLSNRSFGAGSLGAGSSKSKPSASATMQPLKSPVSSK